MSNDNHIVFEIDSHLSNVRLVGYSVRALAEQYFDNEKSIAIELSLVEAVNNCIEHAYQYSENKIIRIELSINNDVFIIKIIDEGKSMPDGLLDNTSSEFDFNVEDIANLPEGSFGLTLIKNNMHKVTYDKEQGRNILTMEKRIDNKAGM